MAKKLEKMEKYVGNNVGEGYGDSDEDRDDVEWFMIDGFMVTEGRTWYLLSRYRDWK